MLMTSDHYTAPCPPIRRRQIQQPPSVFYNLIRQIFPYNKPHCSLLNTSLQLTGNL